MRKIEIVDYRPEWPEEFAEMADRLRDAGAANVLRIDHIGSTAVVGLAAKDVIDIQVTVGDLTHPDHVHAFESAGFRRRPAVVADRFTGMRADSLELRKHYFREAQGERRTHVHVREAGRLNQRYALLFRDYLRADDIARQAYETVKRQLAEAHAFDIDAYLAVKNPVMDVVYRGAEHWAATVKWQPGP